MIRKAKEIISALLNTKRVHALNMKQFNELKLLRQENRLMVYALESISRECSAKVARNTAKEVLGYFSKRSCRV